MEDLLGKVAVVTGAASGIGLALTRALLAQGAKVVMADIEVDALEAASVGLGSDAEVLTMVCDVSDPVQVEALRDAAVARFGTVHVVVNNAGVSSAGPVWTQSLEDWQWVLGVNLYGVVNGIRTFAPLLIEQGEGHIVNTASMAGLTSPPFMSTYNVSKHAVVTLSETLFADLALAGASGVGVSVLCPGWVRTRIHEAARNRPGSPDPDVDGPTAGFGDFVGALIADGLDPDDVADQVIDAILTRRFYILTHPDWMPMITGRVDRIVEGRDPAVAGLPEPAGEG
ncbi:MAG: SDR family NAD(P)-dependent oxidoreductase [Microthrixaceae bacterium]|nr:SDR family NAD(P)-dependent oxidoreductase [Microthrixaceae bacterium]